MQASCHLFGGLKQRKAYGQAMYDVVQTRGAAKEGGWRTANAVVHYIHNAAACAPKMQTAAHDVLSESCKQLMGGAWLSGCITWVRSGWRRCCVWPNARPARSWSFYSWMRRMGVFRRHTVTQIM